VLNVKIPCALKMKFHPNAKSNKRLPLLLEVHVSYTVEV